MKLTSWDGEQTVSLDWGGLSGRAIILTVGEQDDDGNRLHSEAVLTREECWALAEVLTKMAEEQGNE